MSPPSGKGKTTGTVKRSIEVREELKRKERKTQEFGLQTVDTKESLFCFWCMCVFLIKYCTTAMVTKSIY